MGVTGMAPLPALGGDTAGRKERKRSNEEKKKRRKEEKWEEMKKEWLVNVWKYRMTI